MRIPATAATKVAPRTRGLGHLSFAAVRRLLFVAADVPWPPDGGGRIASRRVLEAFCRHAEVDLVALADPLRPLDLGPLKSICATVEVVPHPFTFGLHPARQLATAAWSITGPDPYRIRKFRSRALRSAVAERLRDGRYDLVHHEQLGVAQYHHPTLPATACVHNVEAEIYRRATRNGRMMARAWAHLEAAKLRRREPALLTEFDHVFVLSEQDRRLLDQVGVPGATVLPMPAPTPWPRRSAPAAPRILTIGSMSWFGVVDGLEWFHDRVLPLVREQVPDIAWDLAGPGAPGRVQTWAGEPGVRVHGYVDDLEDLIFHTRVAVVPLRVAGGIRMKLLDLMAWGVPSVATSIGAEGLGFADGSGCFRRDEAKEFAAAVTALLTDDSAWQRATDLGRSYLTEHHRALDLEDAVVAGVESAVERHRSRNLAAAVPVEQEPD